MFEGKKVIIFDMDGTLIDSVGVWNEIDKNLIRKLGALEELDDKQIQKQRDTLLREFSKVENPYMEYCKCLAEKYHSRVKPRRNFEVKI